MDQHGEQIGRPEDVAAGAGGGAAVAAATRHEQARVEAVHALRLLQEPVAAGVDQVILLAAELCHPANATINIVDEDWLHSIAATGGPRGRFAREDIPCDLVVRTGRELVAEDLREVPVLADSPVVDGTLDRIGCYASVPLRTSDGHVVGTLCVWDSRPRRLTEQQLNMLRILADHAIGIFQMGDALQRAQHATERLTQAHRAAEQLFAAAFRHASDGIVVLAVSGPDAGQIVRANPAVTTIIGRSAATGTTLADMLDSPRLSADDKRDRRALLEELDLLIAEPPGTFHNDTVEHLTRMPVGTGHIFVQLLLTLTRDGHGRPEYALVQMRDVTTQQAHEQSLVHQTRTDPLTGLGNRAAMRERLAEEIAALRFGDSGLGVLMIDLDNFRTVNDRLGHPAGDDLLGRISTALVEVLPVEAFASRLGADKFVVLAPSSSQAALRELAEEVSGALGAAAAYFNERLQVLVGVSIGLAFSQDPDSGPEELLKAADTAMYENKRHHRLTTKDAGTRPTLVAVPSPRGNEPVPAPTPAPRVNPRRPGEKEHPAHSRGTAYGS